MIDFPWDDDEVVSLNPWDDDEVIDNLLPFEGESFGELAGRRGQQVVAGAAEISKGISEGFAVAGASAERNIREQDASRTFADERDETIAGMRARLEEPDLKPSVRAHIERNLADLEQGQGVLRDETPQAPATEDPIYKKGQEQRDRIVDAVGAPDPRDTSFWGKLATGAGSVGGFVAAGTVAGPLGVVGAGSAVNSAQIYGEAIEAGADEETALEASKWGAVFGASEALPITRALKLLPEGIRGRVTNTFLKKITHIATSAGEEAAQEWAMTVANNLTAQRYFDAERGWSEGATEAALIGGILGGGLAVPGSFADEGTDQAPPTRPRPGFPDPDRERTDSPRLDSEDRASPLQNDVIDDGKKVLDSLLGGDPASGDAPSAPPLDLGPFRTDDPGDASGATPAAPSTPPAPTSGGAADPATDETGRYEIIDEIDGDTPTGRKLVLDTKTGKATPLPGGQADRPVQGPPEMQGPQAPQGFGAATTAPSPTPEPNTNSITPTTVDLNAPLPPYTGPASTPNGTYETTITVNGQTSTIRGPAAHGVPDAGTQGFDATAPSPTPAPTDQETSAPETPANQGFGPAPAPAQSNVDQKTDVAVTPRGRQVPVRYEVRDASELTTSNTADGAVNPAYPKELQPRDRSRGTSQEQVRKIAQNLNPQLLGRSPSAGDGAPIIGPDGVVESGNGRTMAITQAYAEGKGEAYRAFLAEQGFDTTGIERPVLVRVRQGDMTPEDRAAFTREANERTTAAMSATEQAMADANALPDDILPLYRGGDVDAAGNRDFVRRFLEAVVPESDRGAMIDKDGRVSQEAVRRVQASLIAKAYGDAGLVSALVEATDNNIKSIGGALIDVAPQWAQMRREAASGQIAPEMDQTAALLEAVRIVNRARMSGRNLAEFVNQTDLLAEGNETVSPTARLFLGLMFRNKEQWTNPVGRDKLADALRFYTEEAGKTTAGADMLGETADPGRVLDAAERRREGKDGGQQAGFFDRPAQGGEGDGGGSRPDSTGGERPAGEAGDATGGRPAPARPETRGPWKLADDLSERAQKTLHKYRDSSAGELVAELDNAARRADAALRRRESRQDRELRDEAVFHAEEVLEEVRKAKTGELDWPERNEDTGEYDYELDHGNEVVFQALLYLDAFEGMGVNIDAMDPEAELEGWMEGAAERGEMDPADIFPAAPKVRNLDLEAKREGYIDLEEAKARIEAWKAEARRIGETGANRRKIIVSLFDYTGQWSQPWEDAGYQVLRYDIKSGTDLLLSDFPWNRLAELRDGGMEVVGVLSATPCTTFAVSGSQWWETRHNEESEAAIRKVWGEPAIRAGARTPLDYNLMLVKATRDLISVANPTGWHVLENPIGRIGTITDLPDQPTARFEPHTYGDPYTKRTQLWGVFNTDLPTANVSPKKEKGGQGSKMHDMRGTDPATKEKRSETPEGFSYSFFMANEPLAEAAAEPAATPSPRPTPKPTPAPDPEGGMTPREEDEAKRSDTSTGTIRQELERAIPLSESERARVQALLRDPGEHRVSHIGWSDQIEISPKGGPYRSGNFGYELYLRPNVENDGSAKGWSVTAVSDALGRQVTGDKRAQAVKRALDRMGAQAATTATPAKESQEQIGTNLRGTPVYEDENGVRYILSDGVKITEGVVVPPQGEIEVPSNAERVAKGDERFLTAEEYEQVKEDEKVLAEFAAIDAQREKDQANAEPVDMEDFAAAGMTVNGGLAWFKQPAQGGRGTRTYRVNKLWNDKNKRWNLKASRSTDLDAGPTGPTNPPTVELGDFPTVETALIVMREDGMTAEPVTETTNEGFDLDAAFDEVYGPEETTDEGTGQGGVAPSGPRKPRPPRSSGEAASSAASNIGESFEDFAKGLNELFGGDGTTLNVGVSFDRERYEKAKPIFIAAARKLGAAIRDLQDLAVAIVRELRSAGLTRQAAQNMRPYIERFMRDVKAGEVSLAESVDTASSVHTETGQDGEFRTALIGGFHKALAGGERFSNIIEARKKVKEYTGRDFDPETMKKDLEEAIEVAVAQVARKIASDLTEPEGRTFDALVDLYSRQPKLLQRTSTSVELMAYSTPAPLAFLASRLAKIGPQSRVYEPSAGNGMLLMEARPANVTANELQPSRVDGLRRVLGGDATITTGDAMAAEATGYTRLIANPPFGKVRDDTGKVQTWDLAGVTGETTEIDHAIVMRGLDGLAEGGRAVLLIGGQKGETQDARKLEYQKGERRKFFKKLYDNYAVEEHFTVAGALYSRQGAEWPVDVIVVAGKGAATKPYPMKEAPALYSTWDQLGERLDGKNSLDPRALGGDVGLGSDRPGDAADAGQVSGGTGDADRPAGATGGAGGGGASSTSGGGRRPDADAGDGGRPASVGERDAGEQIGDGGDGLSGAEAATRPGDDAGGARGGDVGDVPRPPVSERAPVKRENAEAETAHQVKYTPHSQAEFAVGTVVPVNMQQAMDRALNALAERIADRHASIDEYVAHELGYTLDELLGTPGTDATGRGEVVAEPDLNDLDGTEADGWTNIGGVNGADGSSLGVDIREVRERDIETGDTSSVRQIRLYDDMRGSHIAAWEWRKNGSGALGLDISTAGYHYVLSDRSEEVFGEDIDNTDGDAVWAEYGPDIMHMVRDAGEIAPLMLGGPAEPATEGKPGYFSAEQVDALALAIDNVAQGKGFIIGDQTGVGKGRFVAAMLRYGQRKGLTPVFVTAKPGLFEDMIRDMQDIGMPDVHKSVLITNANIRGKNGLNVRGHKGKFMAPTAAKLRDALAAMTGTGRPPKEYSMVFTTYDQMNESSAKPKAGRPAPKPNPRRPALSAIAGNAMFVLDESHEAGGVKADPRGADEDKAQPRSEFIRELVRNAQGTVFSSATYAKNPAVMTLYSPTDLSMIVDNINELTGVIESGGVPLQQVLANMLVESGQYARRERSYEGIDMKLEQLVTDKAMADRGAGVLRNLFELDTDVMQDVRAAYIEGAKEEGLGGVRDSGVGSGAMSSTNFASTMHNLASQFLLAIKVDAVVEEAIRLHKMGRKPIIAVSNTNASIIAEAAEKAGVGIGDTLAVPFNVILERYLDRLRRITVKDEDDNVSYVYLTDAEIAQYGGQDALDAFNKAKEVITKADLSGLPGAPIDAILDRLEAAGIASGEITGRNETLRGGVLERREASAAVRGATMRAYNSGELDALVINRSGATGFSLHAKGKELEDGTFEPERDADGTIINDGKMRHMIILQPEPNIDTFMQMLGRVHRTGQIRLPAYTIAVSDLAVEKRPAAVLMRKMASLNANTTASKRSAVSLDNVTDFLNPYGDKVVLEYLRENPELAAMLDVTPSTKFSDGIAAKFTGRLASMPPDQVTRIYEEVEANYIDYIDSLDRMGMNALEAKTLELDARTVSKTELVPAKDESSPFGRAAFMEQIEAKRLGKPYSPVEIDAEVKKVVGDDLSEAGRRAWGEKQIAKLRAMLPGQQQALAEQMERAQAKLAEAKTDKQKDAAADAIKRAGVAQEELRGRMDAIEDLVGGALMPDMPGRISVRQGEGEEAEFQTLPGVSLGADLSKLKTNPTAASQITVRIAIADAGREIRVPLSKFLGSDPEYRWDPLPQDQLPMVVAAFEAGQSDSRETRNMVTGNIPAGYSKFKKGQIVMYTDDQGQIRQGILLPKSFDPARALANQPVRFAEVSQVAEFLQGGTEGTRIVKSEDGVLRMSYTGGQFTIAIVPPTVKKYILNKAVRKLVGDWDARKGAKMVQKRTRRDVFEQVLQIYADNIGTEYSTTTARDEAREITGEALPDLPGTDTPPLVREQRARAPRRTPQQLVQGVSALPPKLTEEALPELRAELDRMMLQRVNLGLDTSGRPRQGVTMIPNSGVGPIDILIGHSLDPKATLYHESIHVMRSMNLFSSAEWEALSDAAPRWIKKHGIHKTYSDLGPVEQIEEAIAEEFGLWAAGKTRQEGPIARAFAKMRRFLKAIRNVFSKRGKTVEDIFGKALSGEIGRRGPSNTGTVAMQKAQEQRMENAAARAIAPYPKPSSAPGNSMTGGLFLPDRRIWDELLDNQRSIWGRLKGGAAAAHDRVDRIRVQVQDRFLPILRAQEAVARARGEPISQAENAYMAEETYSGKVGRHLDEIDREYTKPIISIIAKARGLTDYDVGRWLYARHALERNEHIASINEEMPDGGSGMPDAEAKAILAAAEAGPHKDALERIGQLIDKLRERTLELRYTHGLLSEEQADLWRVQYEHFVPLKGWNETDHSEATLSTTGVGRRFAVRGRETRQALGRGTEAFNPLHGALVEAQEAAIRAEKNRVGQALLELVENNEAPAMWSVKRHKQKRYYNRATGLVETRVENPLNTQLAPNETAVKVDGKEVRIVFHDPRLAAAAGSVGADQIGPILKIGMMFSRWFSAVNTMLNPEFVVTNGFRDMQTAQVNIQGFGEKDRAALSKAMLKDWRKAFWAAWKGQEGDQKTEWGKWWTEYEKAGARVNFWQMDLPEAGVEDFNKRVKYEGGNVLQRSKRFVAISTRDNPLLHQIERVNLAVDNAVRLSAYVAARKAGWSQPKAASLAKNLTVNFNRRGEVGTGINAAYPFFNAAIQGTQILLKAGTHKRVRRIMLGLVAAGIIEDFLNASLSDEDEDGELAWDKVEDWKLRRNLMLNIGGDNPYSIPMPYGYNLFPYMGKQISKVGRGVKKPGDALGDVLATAFEAFSPISGGTLWQTVIPTAGHPVIETAFNRNWQGRNIRPEDPYGDYGPQAYKHFAGASEVSREIADLLNRGTGGNRAEAGFIDVSPEYIDHVAGWVTGGAGRFTGRVTDIAHKIALGNSGEIEQSDVPFMRQLKTETGSWLDQNRYYRFRDEVLEAKHSAEGYLAQGQKVPERIARIARLETVLKSTESSLRAKRKALASIEARGDLSPEKRARHRKMIEDAQTNAYLGFNKRFIAVAGPRAE